MQKREPFKRFSFSNNSMNIQKKYAYCIIMDRLFYKLIIN